MLASLARRPALVALLLALAAQLLFAFHLDRPSKLSFDEVHYVPAARTLLALERPVNIEHPLMGKALIAAGIATFGDTPTGWRAASSLAGSATVAAIFWILWLLFGRVRTAAFGALLGIAGQTVFVQARTAMLDGFLVAFLMLAIGALLWAMRAPPGRAVPRIALAAILFGLAVGTKWAAIPYVAAACIGILWARRGAPHRFGGTGAVPAILLLGLVSIATYVATFLPAFLYASDPLTPGTFISFQFDMLARQRQILPSHPYQSAWWTWPLLLRPIWYFYEPDMGAVRGVLLIGSPLVMWGGLVAVALCLWAGIRQRSRPHLALALLWIGSVAMWAIIPKSLGFYYYYYPSSVLLCLAIAGAFHAIRHRWPVADEWFAFPAVGLFVHFYPILAASALHDAQDFTRWMWLPGWR